MFCIRRAALRALHAPTPIVQSFAKPRSLTTFTPSLLRQPHYALNFQLQKRLASDDAQRTADQLATDQTRHGEEELHNAEIQKIQQEPTLEAHGSAAESATPGEAPVQSEGASAQSTLEDVKDMAAGSAAKSAAATNTAPRSQPGPNARPRQGQNFVRNPIDPVERNVSPNNTLYVGNLFFDVTEDDLKREFGRFGSIKSVRLIYDGRGLSKGFGYVEFEDLEAATEALKNLDQQIFEGRRMAVQYRAAFRNDRAGQSKSEPREPKPPSKTLFIGNMSFEMTDQDLNDLFGQIENVIDVRVAIDRRTGQPRGFAHADFIDIPSAEKALNVLRNKIIYGRNLRVDFGTESRGLNRGQ